VKRKEIDVTKQTIRVDTLIQDRGYDFTQPGTAIGGLHLGSGAFTSRVGGQGMELFLAQTLAIIFMFPDAYNTKFHEIYFLYFNREIVLSIVYTFLSGSIKVTWTLIEPLMSGMRFIEKSNWLNRC